MTENQPVTRNIPAVILQALAWITYLACVLSTLMYLSSYTGPNGGWAIIIMMFCFAPAFLVFLITGGIAQRLDAKFAKTFFTQNLLLILLGLVGILLLLLATLGGERDSLYGPPPVTNPENLMMLVIVLLIPGGLGMGLSKILPHPKE